MDKDFIRKTTIAYFLLISCLMIGCAAARTSARIEAPSQLQDAAERSAHPTSAPGMIYVSDFAIDTEDITEEKGILSRSPLRERRVGRSGPLNRGERPNVTARRLVDSLADGLVKDLAAKSLPARRMGPGMSLPSNGWLIQGQFLEVDKGNRMRRAVIGFGAGETNMEIEVTVIDLSSHSKAPFLILSTQADSGKLPGAFVTMNPYVAAVRFVLSKNASEKDVKHCASQIASEIVDYMKAHGLSATS